MKSTLKTILLLSTLACCLFNSQAFSQSEEAGEETSKTTCASVAPFMVEGLGEAKGQHTCEEAGQSPDNDLVLKEAIELAIQNAQMNANEKCAGLACARGLDNETVCRGELGTKEQYITCVSTDDGRTVKVKVLADGCKCVCVVKPAANQSEE